MQHVFFLNHIMETQIKHDYTLQTNKKEFIKRKKKKKEPNPKKQLLKALVRKMREDIKTPEPVEVQRSYLTGLQSYLNSRRAHLLLLFLRYVQQAVKTLYSSSF